MPAIFLPVPYEGEAGRWRDRALRKQSANGGEVEIAGRLALGMKQEVIDAVEV
jgi:hypothetical protein